MKLEADVSLCNPEGDVHGVIIPIDQTKVKPDAESIKDFVREELEKMFEHHFYDEDFSIWKPNDLVDALKNASTMNGAKSGFTLVELLVVVGILAIAFSLVFGVFNKHIVGNKQLVDFNQNFNVAYVLGDDGKFEKVKIKAWKDWEKSDAIQVIDMSGHPIYTHLANVKLVHE